MKSIDLKPQKGYIRQGILEGRPRFWDASADSADSADAPETESPPAGQTRTNRACFPDDARSTRQTPSNKGRTELQISLSGAKNVEEVAGDVRFGVAPLKTGENTKKTIF